MDRARELDPPLPPVGLVRQVKRLKAILDELVEVTDAEDIWGIRSLRSHVALALESPSTLTSARNQVDFVIELLAAVWEGCEAGFGGLRAGPNWAETGRRQERLEELREELLGLADGLGEAVETWRRSYLR
ncbi:MAG: hypothetical protein M3024_14400 [Candidatus Dormibacteraeota bacterium]|nr:hypothetical protein [Candidatus Dormibacteraeota bacterium]